MRLLPRKTISWLFGVLTGLLIVLVSFANTAADSAALFNHLVGAAEDWNRHANTERLGSLQVDIQLDLGGLLNW